VNLEGGRSQIWLAPFRAAAQTPNSEWIPVTDGTSWDSAPQLSPGGRMIYYTSGRDGSRCVWGRHLDPNSGRPTGEPFAVYHFHSARLSPALVPFNGIDLFVTADQLLIGLGELSGSIWTGRMSL
jgi:WD40 repeat protein